MYNYFKIKDFNCQQTGENKMSKDFIHLLDELREECGFPFIITSGYRSPDHSIERYKDNPGTHTQGIASDIRVGDGNQRYKIVEQAIYLGFTGIGIAKEFIHLDTRVLNGKEEPVIWCY